MSMETTNLKLEKPGTDEFYDVNVQNRNMDKLDTKVKSLEDGIGGISVPVTKVNNKTGDVVLSAGDIKASDNKTIEQKFTALASDLAEMATNKQDKLTISSATNSTSTTQVANSQAVKTAYDLANGKAIKPTNEATAILGQYLKSNGNGTSTFTDIITKASGWELISSIAQNVTATSIVFDNIPIGYEFYKLIGWYANNSANTYDIFINLNNIATTNYSNVVYNPINNTLLTPNSNDSKIILPSAFFTYDTGMFEIIITKPNKAVINNNRVECMGNYIGKHNGYQVNTSLKSQLFLGNSTDSAITNITINTLLTNGFEANKYKFILMGCK